jgi:hypothetical protein
LPLRPWSHRRTSAGRAGRGGWRLPVLQCVEGAAGGADPGVHGQGGAAEQHGDPEPASGEDADDQVGPSGVVRKGEPDRGGARRTEGQGRDREQFPSSDRRGPSPAQPADGVQRELRTAEPQEPGPDDGRGRPGQQPELLGQPAVRYVVILPPTPWSSCRYFGGCPAASWSGISPPGPGPDPARPGPGPQGIPSMR